jgi:hypothetical protein
VSARSEARGFDSGRKSLAGKALDRPDLVRKVHDKTQKDGVVDTIKMVSLRLVSPLVLRYSCAGVVAEVDAIMEEFAVIDRDNVAELRTRLANAKIKE